MFTAALLLLGRGEVEFKPFKRDGSHAGPVPIGDNNRKRRRPSQSLAATHDPLRSAPLEEQIDICVHLKWNFMTANEYTQNI